MILEIGQVVSLQTKLQHGHIDFVKKREMGVKISQYLYPYGFNITERGGGLLVADCGLFTSPIAIVENEKFFEEIKPNPNTEVLGMDPYTWSKEGLVVLDSKWPPASLVSDLVLQALIFKKQYDFSMNYVLNTKYPPAAEAATNTFLAKGLQNYRRNWYSWLQMGI
jgi:hypothetical protein